MHTERLYWYDSYLKEFESTVVTVKKNRDSSKVLLDRTIFYPTSGGQMHDTGYIDEFEVVDVIEEGDEVVHVVNGILPAGKKVICKLNWKRRFDFMQQHTAFHLLAQAFQRIANANTLSSHLGEAVSTIDLDIEVIDPELVFKVEDIANRIIHENRPIQPLFLESEQLAALKLRKEPPSEKDVRLIEIKDFDLDPCAGTHTRRTGEVGMVKILGSEKIRGTLRFEFLAGRRAYEDYQRKHDVLSQLGRELTTGPEDMLGSVQKLKAELRQADKRCRELSDALMAGFSEKIVREARESGGGFVARIVDDFEWEQVRKAALASLKQGRTSIFLAQRKPSLRVLVATGDKGRDLRQLVPELTQLVAGKGGGRPDLIEIGGSDGRRLEEAIAAARRFLGSPD